MIGASDAGHGNREAAPPPYHGRAPEAPEARHARQARRIRMHGVGPLLLVVAVGLVRGHDLLLHVGRHNIVVAQLH